MDKEKLTRGEILEFLENFGMYRPGNYDVSIELLELALDEYMKTREIERFLRIEAAFRG